MAADWYQQSLTPPEVVEVRIRLGVIPEHDHAQVLVELYDPITGVLTGQWSRPHASLDRWLDLLDWAHTTAKQHLGQTIEPF